MSDQLEVSLIAGIRLPIQASGQVSGNKIHAWLMLVAARLGLAIGAVSCNVLRFSFALHSDASQYCWG